MIIMSIVSIVLLAIIAALVLMNLIINAAAYARLYPPRAKQRNTLAAHIKEMGDKGTTPVPLNGCGIHN